MADEAAKFGPVGHLWLDPVTKEGVVYMAFGGGGAAALEAAVKFATAQAGRMYNSKGTWVRGRAAPCPAS